MRKKKESVSGTEVRECVESFQTEEKVVVIGVMNTKVELFTMGRGGMKREREFGNRKAKIK